MLQNLVGVYLVKVIIGERQRQAFEIPLDIRAAIRVEIERRQLVPELLRRAGPRQPLMARIAAPYQQLPRISRLV